MRTEQRNDGALFTYAGASRSGKTTGVLARVKNAKRILVRDPRAEYAHALGLEIVKTPDDLRRALRASWDGPGRFSYFGPASDITAFAEMAYAWVQLWPSVIVLEENADVSSSGKARDGVGELIRKGLYFGAHIYAVTQRPQETDKTTWGNASVIRCHHFPLPLDQRYMADLLGVDPAEVGALSKGEYIERRQGVKDVKRGKTAPLS